MDSELKISEGFIRAIYAFEIGYEVNLSRALKLLDDPVQRKFSRRQSGYFGYDPPPLRVVKLIHPYEIGELTIDRRVEITIWEFGAVSLTYSFALPENTSFEHLINFSTKIATDEQLDMDAREQVRSVVETIREAISKESIAAVSENYLLFYVRGLNHSINAENLIQSHSETIAKTLRQDTRELSQDVINDALKHRFSQTVNDTTIVDWSSAFLFGPDDDEDVQAVLEYVTVQLLELRFLDEMLDDCLQQAQFDYHNRTFLSTLTSSVFRKNSGLASLARLVVDFTSVVEALNSAINIIEDATLVHIHELASSRFGLKELTTHVRDKISHLRDLREQLKHEEDAFRSHFLEFIIIVLILFEIFQGL